MQFFVKENRRQAYPRITLKAFVPQPLL